jgi:hypothetical protein
MRAADGQGCVGRHWAFLHHSKNRKARGIPIATPSDPAEKHKDRWEPHGYQTETLAEPSAGVPTVRQSFSLLTVIKRRTSQASLKSERTVANINDLP